MPLLYTWGRMITRNYYGCIDAIQLLHQRTKEASINILYVLLFSQCVAVVAKLVWSLDVDINCIDRLEAIDSNFCFFLIVNSITSLEHLYPQHLGNPDLDWHINNASYSHVILFVDRFDIWILVARITRKNAVHRLFAGCYSCSVDWMIL